VTRDEWRQQGCAQGCIKLGLAHATKATELGLRGAWSIVLVVALVLVLEFPALSGEDEDENEDEDD